MITLRKILAIVLLCAFTFGCSEGNKKPNIKIKEKKKQKIIDYDGDGISDSIDTDDDNDGIPDNLDPAPKDTDADDDGVPDNVDVDIVGGSDSDGDGIVDSADVDNTGGTDNDGDGVDDSVDTDDDNDGLDDSVDPNDNNPDSDGDGIDDNLDTDTNSNLYDSDGDGIADKGDADAPENDGKTDTDEDGIIDDFDNDDDGDGIPDYQDANPNDPDSDSDGIQDGADASVTGEPDTDGDGIIDAADPDHDGGPDTDGDGVSDSYDNDDDGDGLNDLRDPNDNDTDSDDDGVIDGGDASTNPAYDDEDNDGVADRADADHASNSGADDLDNDGIIDEYDNDVDGDGIPNDSDTDDDNDGIPDSSDADPYDPDSDNDGIVDGADASVTGGTDTDGDGIIDAADPDNGGGADYDGDGISDSHDNDDDNDGLEDSRDPDDNNIDSDGDGILDGADPDTQPDLNDSDGDGVADVGDSDQSPGADYDNDGILDDYDNDDDNDGVNDADDPNDNNTDSDGDGVPDNVDVDIQGGADTDGDDIIDTADVDTTGGADFDGDGIDDNFDTDDDNDGIADQYDNEPLNEDSDNDGIKDGGDTSVNTRAPDADSDGVADVADKDHASNSGEPDSDSDGVIDSYDTRVDPDKVVIETQADGSGAAVTTLSMDAGDTVTLYSVARDTGNNFVRAESVTWTVPDSEGSFSQTTGSSTVFTAQKAGIVQVTADHASLIDDSTGNITISAIAKTQVVIVDAAGGAGDPIDTASLGAGADLNLYAIGTDAYGNYISDESVDWTVTNSIGTLSAATGTSTILTGAQVGTGVVTADHATLTDDSTGTITITFGAANKFVITTANQTAELGEDVTIDIEVQDSGGNIVTNYTDDVTVTTNKNATGAGLVDIVNGEGSIVITDTTAEIVSVGLDDSEGTGLNTNSSMTITFNAPDEPILQYHPIRNGQVSKALTINPKLLLENASAITACGIKSGSANEGSWPAWASIDATTCVITGTPDAALAQTQFTFVATNSHGVSEDATIDLQILLNCNDNVPGGSPRYFAGDGTSGDPYQICDYAQLQSLAATTADWASGTYFKLITDIEAPDATPFGMIGDNSTNFQGEFNGDNYTIKDVVIDNGANSIQGLFGATNNAVIENLILNNIDVTGSAATTASLIGNASSTDINNIHLINCDNTATFQSGILVGATLGVLTTISNISIEDSSLNCSSSQCGSLVGEIKAETNISDIEINNLNLTGNTRLGGAVGLVNGTSSFDRVHIDGINISTANNQVGGIFGLSDQETVSITQSSVKNINININNSAIGGLIGEFYMGSLTIEESFATGNITGTYYIGGLIGELSNSPSASITDSYTQINVTATSGSGIVGGIIGYATSSGGTTLERVYASGISETASNSYEGGLIGRVVSGGLTITDSFYDADVCNGNSCNYNSNNPKASTNNMQAWEFLASNNYDIFNGGKWAMPSGGGYAVLAWQEGSVQYAPVSFAAGDGTSGDPFVIETVAQFNSIGFEDSNFDAGKYFLLNADLDFTSETKLVIGTYSRKFKGVFEGNNHTISNFTLNNGGTSHTAIFGYIDGATFKNLILDNVNITTETSASSGTGGLIGTGLNCTLENITMKNSDLVSGGYGGLLTGALNDCGTIKNITLEDNTVTCPGGYVCGGVSGDMHNTSAEDITITNLSFDSANAGGFVGDVTTSTPQTYTRLNLTNISETTGVSRFGGVFARIDSAASYITISEAKVDGFTCTGGSCQSTGGIIGDGQGNLFIHKSYVKNINVASGGQIGGIVGSFGDDKLILTESFSSGTMTGSSSIGGIVGYIHRTSNSTLTDNYSSANVTATHGTSNFAYVGGIAGYVYDNTSMKIERNYFSGVAEATTGGTYEGGIVGRLYGSVTRTNVFYDSDVCNGTACAAGASNYDATTAELQSKVFLSNNNYAFSNLNEWRMPYGGGYAILSWDAPLDTDGDGIPDSTDASPNNVDSDSDNIQDGADVSIVGGSDADADGVIDAADADHASNAGKEDTDSDGIIDHYDADNDNDGVYAAFDPNDFNPDADGDGVQDLADWSIHSGSDIDNDEIIDTADINITGGTDLDGDGVDDNTDYDDDNDLIADIYDGAPFVNDIDSDGLLDGGDASVYTRFPDDDSDGVADVADADHASNSGESDDDGDGIIDRYDLKRAANKFIIVTTTNTIGVGANLTIDVEVQDEAGKLIPDFNTDVTLTTTGDATGAGLIDISNGTGSIIISNATQEMIAVGLSDSQATGNDVSSKLYVDFIAGAAPTLAYYAKRTAVDGTAVIINPSVLTSESSEVTACGVKSGSPNEGSWPAWASIDANTCVISGTPDATLSETQFTFVATNSDGTSGDALMNLEVVSTCGDNVPGGSPRYFAGDGTIGDPYQICSYSQLENLAATSSDWASGIYFKLIADIAAPDLTPFGMIGLGTDFEGSFDGNNHIISDIVIDNGTTSYQGIFSKTNNATISNLILENINVTNGSSYGGSLIGRATNTTITNINIRNSSSRTTSTYGGVLAGYITSTSTLTNITIENSFAICSSNCGGVTGYLSGSDISNLEMSNLEVTSSSSTTGGVAGSSAGATNFTDITGTNITLNGTGRIGGVVGYSASDNILTRITLKDVLIENVTNDIGGLVGNAENKILTILQSGVENLEITSNSTHIGGLIGYFRNNTLTIAESFSTGSIKGSRYTGGLIGRFNDSSTSSITDSYSLVDVSSTHSTGYTGGIIGYTQSTSGSSMTRVFYAGVAQTIPGSNNEGGIIGYSTTGLSISRSYYDYDLCNGIGCSGGGSSNRYTNSNAIKTWQFFASRTFDFTNSGVWAMPIEGGYPRLAWEDGTVQITNTPPAGGDGTIGTPFQIATIDQFNSIVFDATNLNAGKYFELAANIDFAGSPVVTIGANNGNGDFLGNFDGNNFTLSNASISGDSTGYTGLFGDVIGGSITNITLDNIDITGVAGSYHGSLAGRISSSTLNNITIKNAQNTATGGQIGALSGHISSSVSTSNITIEDSSITCTSNNCGGLTGGLNNSDIDNITVTNVTINNSISANIGGVVGGCTGTSNFTDITGTNITLSGGNDVGGAVGELRCNSILTRIKLDGVNISGSPSNTGGIIGYAEDFTQSMTESSAENINLNPVSNKAGGLIGYSRDNTFALTESFATGSLVGTSQIGGIVGMIYNTDTDITDCYSTVNVTGTQNNSSLGGIIGYTQLSTGSTTKNSYYTGVADSLTGNTFEGGLVGDVNNSVTFQGTFFDVDVCNTTACTLDDNYNDYANTAALQSWEFLASHGWELTAGGKWGMPSGGGYPLLQWQADSVPVSVTAFAGGDGSSGTPYLIANTDQYNSIALDNSNLDSGVYFKLTSNLDFTGKKIVTLGNPSSSVGDFEGNFDGDNFTISNAAPLSSSHGFTGLYGDINNATITNLTLDNVDVTSDFQYAATLVARSSNSTLNNITITNSDNDLEGYAGHLIGYSSGNTISNITLTSNTITCTAHYCGGITAYSRNDDISNSTLTTNSYTSDVGYVGSISGRIGGPTSPTITNITGSAITVNTGAGPTGGAIGLIDDGIAMTGIHYDGVTSTLAGTYFGGLIGRFTSSGTVPTLTKSSATNLNINLPTTALVGGIMGDLGTTPMTISEVYTTGSITARNGVGGIIGDMGSNSGNSLTDSYSTVSLTSTYSGNVSIGGLVGSMGSSSPSVDRCFFAGTISAVNGNNLYEGGLTGNANGDYIDNSYFDSDVCNTSACISDSTNNRSSVTANMQSWEFFVNKGFDFSTATGVWGMPAATGYPGLAYQTGYDPVDPTAFTSGTGTSGDPYIIDNTEQFNSLILDNSFLASGVYFRLNSNLNFSGKVIANIGSVANGGFQGNFDGNNNTISNATIYEDGDGYKGIFGYSNGATIENLILDNVDVTSTEQFAASLVARANNTTFTNITIKNSDNDLESNGAALIGFSASSSITDITLEDNIIECSSNYCGGLVGRETTGTSSYTDITGTNLTVEGNDTYSGGGVGYVNGDLTVSNFNIDTLIMTANASYKGGIIGYMSKDLTMSESSVRNINMQNGSHIGGLVGNAAGATLVMDVSESFTSGYIKGASYIGGIFGRVQTNGIVDINDSYSIATLEGSTQYVGGLIGYGYGAITNSLFAGTADEGGNDDGGLKGTSQGESAADSHWDSDICTTCSYSYGTSSTFSDMAINANTNGLFSGWDNTAIWDIVDGKHPTLKYKSTTDTIPKANNSFDFIVAQSSSGNVLTMKELLIEDYDDAYTAVTITVKTIPSYGNLKIDGVTAIANDTFTLDDLILGKITYDHTGGDDTDDSFTISVQDDESQEAVNATAASPMTILIDVQ